MSTLSEYCIPFVKKAGYFIPYKSGKADEEIAQARSAVKKLGGEMKDIIVKILPEADRTHLCSGKEDCDYSEEISEKSGTSGKEPLNLKKKN